MKIRLPGLILASLLAGMTLVPASYTLAEDTSDENYTLVLTPKAGDLLGIVPPGPTTANGGFTGNLYVVPKEKWAGIFMTNIISQETNIFAVLAALAPNAPPVTVDKVRGVFQTPFGTICDEHHPTLVAYDPVSVPPIHVEGGFVVHAHADGVVTGGTMAYNKAAGVTHLELTFEVGPNPNPDSDPNTPDDAIAVARSGTFSFEFERRSDSEKICQ